VVFGVERKSGFIAPSAVFKASAQSTN